MSTEETPNTCREFLCIYLSQTHAFIWANNFQEWRSEMLWKITIIVSFMHLELRSEYKEDYLKMGESKVETGLQGR